MTLTITRTRRALAALVPLAIALAACGGDDDVQITDGAVTLDDAGAEAGRVRLPGSAELGAAGAASAIVAVAVEIDGRAVPVTMRLDYEGEVVDADDDGYTIDTTFTGGEVVDAPDDARGDLASITDIVGVTYRQRFDADGTAGASELVDADELTAAQRSAYDEFGSQLDSAALAFPAEPVGEGARWTSVTEIDSQGLEVEVTYHYELTELDGQDYRVTIAYAEDIDTEVQGADVTGTLRGGGSTAATLGDPMSQATTMDQDFDVTFEQGASSTEMSMRVSIEIAPTER